jgi:diguanylate cyclase (GGDEF)-like protein
MKRLILAIAVILATGSAAWAVGPAPLTTLRAIHALSNAEASHKPPVAFEATVTYRRENETTLFVEDAGEGIYVWANAEIKLTAGDRVLVRGKAQDSFRPIVIADGVTLLHHGDLPTPVSATFDELLHGQRDSMLVTVRASVLSADMVGDGDALELLADGGLIDVYIDSRDSSVLKGLLDAKVEVTGVASARFDGKMQQTGVALAVPSPAGIKVLTRADAGPWTLPVTRMGDIFPGYRVKNLSQRVRVHGTITYYQPSSAIVLQSGAQSLWIMTRVESPLRIGEEVDATGFPEVHAGFLALSGGEIQESPVYAPIAPVSVDVGDLAASKHIFDLVSIEGQVVAEVRENSQDEYVLTANGQVFSAIYRHPSIDGFKLLPMNQVQLGSRVRVTGICILGESNPYHQGGSFNILLRSFDDVVVVKRPSLMTIRNLMLLVGLLLAVVAVVGGWGWTLERKVLRQASALSARAEAEAVLERQRSHILEDINGSRPLPNILEKIVELASFSLDGAPCWCEVADGSIVGDRPPEPHDLRIVRVNVESRSGPALGVLFAARGPENPPSTRETASLSIGARLATLAIETRRLYSDLRRRSEFDQLTNIYNRFSLHKRLDVLIQEAGPSGIFGMVFVDLDKFKPINDTFGHHVGDIYLQEVASRMNDQLLGGDMLARLGGDEFAALVSLQHGRFDLNKIVTRLESCFDAPFIIEGHVIKGSASIGVALYPEDGATRDALLTAADATMYEVKNRKRQMDRGGTTGTTHIAPSRHQARDL